MRSPFSCMAAGYVIEVVADYGRTLGECSDAKLCWVLDTVRRVSDRCALNCGGDVDPRRHFAASGSRQHSIQPLLLGGGVAPGAGFGHMRQPGDRHCVLCRDGKLCIAGDFWQESPRPDRGRSQGRRISLGRAVGRYFAKILSGLILAIGYIMVAFTERKQGLHDLIVSTLVVKGAPGEASIRRFLNNGKCLILSVTGWCPPAAALLRLRGRSRRKEFWLLQLLHLISCRWFNCDGSGWLTVGHDA